MEYGRPLEILLIADEPKFGAALHEALSVRGLGVTVRMARSPRAAARILEALRRPLLSLDLIVVDVGIGHGGGYDLVARIKADEDLSHVPVVGISGSGELFECARMARLGAVACLPRSDLAERLPALVARLDQSHAVPAGERSLR